MVSGGNTLFAVDRWRRTKAVEPLQQAMRRGAVLCGGSAGAGCWFDALHSDSMDPNTYRTATLAGLGTIAGGTDASGASSGAPSQWEYIRVPGLGFLPGLLCPHHDQTQSNGKRRSSDFSEMLRRHPGETGLAIDHFAALVISGGKYRVLSLPGRPGSFAPRDGSSASGGTSPACWLKTVADDGVTIEERALRDGERGSLTELLRPAQGVVDDPRIEVARAENPSDNLPA
jgi:dipeptidase E